MPTSEELWESYYHSNNDASYNYFEREDYTGTAPVTGTQFFKNDPTYIQTTTGTYEHGYPFNIVFDTADNLYFVVETTSKNNSLPAGLRILEGTITNAQSGGTAAATIIYDTANDSHFSAENSGFGIQLGKNGAAAGALTIDPVSHTLYFGVSGDESQPNNVPYLEKISYSPTYGSPLVTTSATIVSRPNVDTGSNGGYKGYLSSVAVDTVHNYAYVLSNDDFGDPNSGGNGKDLVDANYFVRIDLANSNSATNYTKIQLTNDYVTMANKADENFSTYGNANGYETQFFDPKYGSLSSVAVDGTAQKLYFTTNGDGNSAYAAGIYEMDLSANGTVGTVNTIYSFSSAAMYLQQIAINTTTGQYYVSGSPHAGALAAANDGGVYVGNLTDRGVAPTRVYDGGTGNYVQGFAADGASVLTGSGGGTATESGSAASASIGGFTLADDEGTVQSATVTISSGYLDNGTGSASHLDSLAFTNQNGITGSYNSGTHTLTLTGVATTANYQTALNSVTLSVVGNDPTAYGTDTSRTLTTTVYDGLLSSNIVTTTVTVSGTNDAPVNTAPGTQTLNEDSSVTIANAFTVADVDSDPTSTNFATVTLSVAHGTLTLGTKTGVTYTTGDGTTDATMTFSGTKAALNTVLNSVTYNPTADYNGSDTITLTTVDHGTPGTATTTSTVPLTITAVNDAPSGADKTITSAENAAYTLTASDFGFSDPNDSPANALSAVKITTLATAGTIADNGTPVTAGQLVSAADINGGLLKFTPAANASGTNYSHFTFQVQDNGGTANGGVNLDQSTNTLTFDVTFVNQPPSGANGSVTALEDTPYALTASNFGYSDADGNSLAAVKITTLPGAGALANNGTAVTAGQSVSAADIGAGHLVFTPAANANGAGYASFTFQVQDNGGTANGGVDTDQSPNTLTVNVTAVNDAPSGANKTITTNEDSGYTFTASDFGFTDPNDSPANALLAVKITTLPGAGTFTNNGTAVTAGQSVSAIDINAGHLIFTPAANANGAGYASFTFQVQDNGGTANGGVDTDQSPNALTVNVTAVDDAPVTVADTYSTAENATLTVAAPGVLGNDTDVDGGPKSVVAVNGVAMNVGTQVTLTSGALVTLNADGSFGYNPNGKFNTLVSASTAASTHASNSSATDGFAYSVNGGSSASVTITVTGVDSPTGDRLGGSTGADTVTGTAAADFFDLSQGGADTASGNGGNDAFYFGAALTVADHVDGGTGADVVAVQGNYPNLLLGAQSLVGVETLSFVAGSDTRFGDPGTGLHSYNVTTVDANVDPGSQLIVNGAALLAGENLTFNGAAETNGSFFIYGGMGTDILTGGAGADVFFMAEGRFNTGDRFDGGGGSDIVVLRGSVTATLAADTLTSIETLTLMSSSDTRFFSGGTRYSYDITSNDGNVAAGTTLTVNGGQLQVGETMRFDGSAETNGSFHLFGGNDNDILIGGAGNDQITGGLGADTLTGGGGNDTFRFLTVADSTVSAHDTIQGFTLGDLLDVSQIDAIAGTPANDPFTFIGANAFHNVAGELQAIQNGANWTVSADIDGDGVADLQFIVMVADAHNLTANDFML